MLPKRLFRVILAGLAVAMLTGCIAVSLKGPLSVGIGQAGPSEDGVLGNLPELKGSRRCAYRARTSPAATPTAQVPTAMAAGCITS